MLNFLLQSVLGKCTPLFVNVTIVTQKESEGKSNICGGAGEKIDHLISKEMLDNSYMICVSTKEIILFTI